MRAVEQPPRWLKFTNPVARALDYAFGCRHSNLSRVFTLADRSYKVCCDCGASFDYSWKDMSIVDQPRALLPALRNLRTRHI
jgi:hypothetical protein